MLPFRYLSTCSVFTLFISFPHTALSEFLSLHFSRQTFPSHQILCPSTHFYLWCDIPLSVPHFTLPLYQIQHLTLYSLTCPPLTPLAPSLFSFKLICLIWEPLCHIPFHRLSVLLFFLPVASFTPHSPTLPLHFSRSPFLTCLWPAL